MPINGRSTTLIQIAASTRAREMVPKVLLASVNVSPGRQGVGVSVGRGVFVGVGVISGNSGSRVIVMVENAARSKR